jgi:hypothetical protein
MKTHGITPPPAPNRERSPYSAYRCKPAVELISATPCAHHVTPSPCERAGRLGWNTAEAQHHDPSGWCWSPRAKAATVDGRGSKLKYPAIKSRPAFTCGERRWRAPTLAGARLLPSVSTAAPTSPGLMGRPTRGPSMSSTGTICLLCARVNMPAAITFPAERSRSSKPSTSEDGRPDPAALRGDGGARGEADPSPRDIDKSCSSGGPAQRPRPGAKVTEAEKVAAVAKLTPHERKLLGLPCA